MIKKSIAYLYNDSVDIKERLYVLNNFFVVVMMVISTIMMAFSDEYRKDTVYMMGVILIIIMLTNLFGKMKMYKAGAALIISFLSFGYFPISFFNENGPTGAAPFWFVYNLFLIAVLLDGKIKIILFALEEVIGVCCYLCSYFFPQFV